MKNIAQKNSNHKIGRILVVDDEAELMRALCEMLVGQGYEAAGFLTGEEALAVLKERECDLLLTDLMMPGMGGIELIRTGLKIDPNLISIIMTGHGTVQTAVEAMKTGAFDYILKPFKLNTLLPLLSRAMQVRNLRLENMQLKETVAIHELGKAISFSSDLNSILNKIADAALQQFSADEVSIMLPTKGGSELYVAVVRGGQTANIGEHAPIEQGIAGWVARNRELVVFRGEVSDPRMEPIRPRNDIHTAVSMPMLSQSKLVGVLNVNITKSHRQFTLGQLKALSILVSIISPILENTALYIQIRQAEEKYRSIFENATEGIYQTTPEGQFITANTSMAAMLGYDSPEELIEAVTDIAGQLYVNPEEWTKLIQLIKDHGQVKTFETRLYRKDGRMIWVSINIRAVCDIKGEFLNYDAIAEDITERKRAEEELKRSHRLQDETEKIGKVGGWEFNIDTGKQTWTEEVYAIHELDFPYDPTVGKGTNFYTPASRPIIEEAIKRAIEHGDPFDVDLEIITAKGNPRSVHAVGKADLENRRVYVFFQDITERKEAEKELKKHRDHLEQLVAERTADLKQQAVALEASNHELESFAYSVSHDLRAPLRGIDGWSLALLEDYKDKLDEQGHQYINRICSETQIMGRLIDDLLMFSRQSRAEMNQRPLDMTAMAQAIISRLQQQNPTLQTDFIVQPGLRALGDFGLIEIALKNLLDNAMKFSSKSSRAVIEFGQVEQEGKKAFFVRDNGVGFDMAYSNKLFGVFQRLHKASEFPGTGIGLASVQRIINRHGGRIWAEAKVNEGATFYFTLKEPI